METSALYMPSLVSILCSGAAEGQRHAAATLLKNACRSWDSAPPDGKAALRPVLLHALAAAPARSRGLVVDVVVMVAAADFPSQWPTFVSEVVATCTAADQHGDVNSVAAYVEVLHMVFKRYRDGEVDAEIGEEILAVSAASAPMVLALLRKYASAATDAATRSGGASPTAPISGEVLGLGVGAWRALQCLFGVVADLTTVDIPDGFDLQIEHLLTAISSALLLPVAAAVSASPPRTAAGSDAVEAAFAAQAAALRLATVFAQNYAEDIARVLHCFAEAAFATASACLLPTAPAASEFAGTCAVLFLAALLRSPQHAAAAFGTPERVAAVMSAVVAPAARLRDADVERAEEDADDYVRRDVAGAEFESRRRAAVSLALAVASRPGGGALLTQHIASRVAAYSAAPGTAWRELEEAIFLATSLCGDAAATGVDTAAFFASVVVPLLSSPPAPAAPVSVGQAMLAASALRFVVSHCAAAIATAAAANVAASAAVAVGIAAPSAPAVAAVDVLASAQLCARWLPTSSPLVVAHAAVAVERLAAKQRGAIPADAGRALLEALFGAVAARAAAETPPSEHLAAAVLRVCALLDPAALAPLVPSAAPLLIADLRRGAGRRTDAPRAAHVGFECLALLARANAAAAEPAEFALCVELLQRSGAEDLLPYALQLLALLARSSPTPQNYAALLAPALHPALWEGRGNVPALVRLVSAILARTPAAAAAVVGDLVRRVAALATQRTQFADAIALAGALAVDAPRAELAPHVATLMGAVLQRLQAAHAAGTHAAAQADMKRASRHAAVLFSVCTVAWGAQLACSAVDAAMPGAAASFVGTVVIPHTPSVPAADRPVAKLATTRLLAAAIGLGVGSAVPALAQNVVGLTASGLRLCAADSVSRPQPRHRGEDAHAPGSTAGEAEGDTVFKALCAAPVPPREFPGVRMGDADAELRAALCHILSPWAAANGGVAAVRTAVQTAVGAIAQPGVPDAAVAAVMQACCS